MSDFREGAAPPAGLEVLARRGDLATARLSLEQLPRIAADQSIERIAFDGVLRPRDDPAVRSVRAARVRPKLGITGRGVLIGVLDTGIDWSHPDFILPDGRSKIRYLLDLSDSPDSLRPGELGTAHPYGGILVTGEEIGRALRGEGEIRQRDEIGHGTMVAGAAAALPSSGGDTLNLLGGAAPGAELVAVKVSARAEDTLGLESNVLNGLAFLDSVARELGRPYVANISVGGILGPHDGSLPFEQFIAGFIGPELPGRAVVVAAGNERDKQLHAAAAFPAGPGQQPVVQELEIGYAGGPFSCIRMEIWLSPGHPGVTMTLVSPDSQVVGIFPTGYADSLPVPTVAGVLMVANSWGGPYPYNNSRVLTVDIWDGAALGLEGFAGLIRIAPGVWRCYLEGTGGSYDAYLESAGSQPVRFASQVRETGTVGSPAAIPEVIAVGSYVGRADWDPLQPEVRSAADYLGELTPGELSSFSSVGPTRLGALKPELTAPGQWVMSALSDRAFPSGRSGSMFTPPPWMPPLLYVATDTIHAVSAGTSFSAPLVAGLAALLLEASPGLTNAEVKRLLTGNASTDSLTGGAPDNFWGYGRADAMAALAELLELPGDSIRLAAELSRPDSLAPGLVRYDLRADLTRSRQLLRSFELQVSWAPDRLAWLASPDSLPNREGLELSIDRSRSGQGQLTVRGLSAQGLPAAHQLLSLLFQRLGEGPDSAVVNFELMSLLGDLEPFELSPQTILAQAPALRLEQGPSCLVRGDADRDGQVDIFDLLTVLRTLSGGQEATPCSDVNSDARTDIFDLLELLRLL